MADEEKANHKRRDKDHKAWTKGRARRYIPQDSPSEVCQGVEVTARPRGEPKPPAGANQVHTIRWKHKKGGLGDREATRTTRTTGELIIN